VQPGLGVQALARETLVVAGRPEDVLRLAEGPEARPPDERAARVRHGLGRAQAVGMHGEDLAFGDQRQRLAVERDVLA
jgi:hypothetical protein